MSSVVRSACPVRSISIGLALGSALFALTVAGAATDPAPVVAEEKLGIDLRLGAFALSSVKVGLRLDGSNGSVGSDVDLTNRFGGSTNLNVFRADAEWAIKGRHGMEFSWYDIKLRGGRTIDTTLSWGDRIFPVNTTLSSEFRTNVYKLSYGYSLYRDDRHEIKGLLGVHIMKFSTSLAASGLGAVESFSATAPLPSFGFAWLSQWNDRFSTRVSLQYFGISLEDNKYSGHFTDFLAAAEYKVTAKAGLGAGYNRFDLKGSFKPDRFKLTADYSYNGLLIYAFVRF